MTLNEMKATDAAKIAAAGAATEAQMREMKAPTHDTADELATYIRSLTDRPHDYGTCVCAMSLAAVAALNHVARTLGVTGFQVSCADIDILRQTRDWKWGAILNFEDLLYPQCAHKFPGWADLLTEHREDLSKRAKSLLAENRTAHPNVRAHWEVLAKAT